MFKLKKAFTLPELLVVIAVVGIISGVAFAWVQGERAKGRDTKRVAEINTLRDALQLYKMDKGIYPTSTGEEAWCSVEGDNLKPGCDLLEKLAPYLPQVPKDPLFGKIIGNKFFSYQYISTSSGAGYKLHADLETESFFCLGAGNSPCYEISGGIGGSDIVYVLPPIPACPNGIREGSELCDCNGPCSGAGETCLLQSAPPLIGGTLSCKDDCSGFDTSTCSCACSESIEGQTFLTPCEQCSSVSPSKYCPLTGGPLIPDYCGSGKPCNCHPQINFDPTSYSWPEEAGMVPIAVVLSESVNATITVQYKIIAGGTAGDPGCESVPGHPGWSICKAYIDEGDDYNLEGNGILTFGPNVKKEYIYVSILDDSEQENDETFFLNIYNASSSYLDAEHEPQIGPDDDFTFTIEDNDWKLYEQQPVSGGQSKALYGDIWGAQTFTVGKTGDNENHYIKSVWLWLKRVDRPSGDLKVSIRNVDGRGFPTGTDLIFGTTTAGDLPLAYATRTIAFRQSPVLLSPNTKYAIVVRCTDANSSAPCYWQADYAEPNGPYSGGSLFTSPLGAPGNFLNQSITTDFLFQEYGSFAPSVSFSEDSGFVDAEDPLTIIYLNILPGAGGAERVHIESTGGTAEERVDYDPIDEDFVFKPGFPNHFFKPTIHPNPANPGARTVIFTLSNPRDCMLVAPVTYTLTIINGEAVPIVKTIDATPIGENSATLKGNIDFRGSANVTKRGFEWGTTTGVYLSSSTETSSYPEGPFDFPVATLKKCTEYFYRAIAYNSVGWGTGEEKSFRTIGCRPPALWTNAATKGATWAILSGLFTIPPLGPNDVTERGFKWGTASGVYPNIWTETSAYYPPGTYTSTINVICDTSYYYRAIAKSSDGWGTATNQIQFTTDGCTTSATPTVVTKDATIIGNTTATFNATITDSGTASTTQKGFRWGTTLGGPYPNIWTQTGTWGAGGYSSSTTGLTSCTNYYYRGIAYNSVGWSTATNEIQFKTTGCDWYDPWLFRKKITIDRTKVAADLIDFPVLISTISADLSSKAQYDGDDILFTLSDGITKVPHEIEKYASSTGGLIAWVKINVSSTADTYLYMYYGNAVVSNQQQIINTWDSSFMMVQHMNGAPYSAVDDSTVNNNDVTGANGCTFNQSAKIGYGVVFSKAASNWLSISDSSTLRPANGITMEAWFKTASITTGQRIFNKGIVTSPYSGYSLLVYADRFLWQMYAGALNQYDDFSATILNNTWYHVVASYDKQYMRVYLNGSLLASHVETDPITHNSTVPLYIGRSNAGGEYFDGLLDEVRISSNGRSAAWISTSYSNQSSPSTFMSFGIEENL
ncbi:MAG: DUF2341 domain-containing protein [Candidatus Nealsonbacteria bacterium]|nr:DUF2341 domain-containing protein [Candidatus Nealsonbacteria bacterium]